MPSADGCSMVPRCIHPWQCWWGAARLPQVPPAGLQQELPAAVASSCWEVVVVHRTAAATAPCSASCRCDTAQHHTCIAMHAILPRRLCMCRSSGPGHCMYHAVHGCGHHHGMSFMLHWSPWGSVAVQQAEPLSWPAGWSVMQWRRSAGCACQVAAAAVDWLAPLCAFLCFCSRHTLLQFAAVASGSA